MLLPRLTCGTPLPALCSSVHSPTFAPVAFMKRRADTAALNQSNKRTRPTSSCPSTRPHDLVVASGVVARAAAASPKTKPSRAQSSTSADAQNSLWLVVGLGNPGANYERTRHNVGFMVVDQLASSYAIDCRKLEKSAAVGKGVLEGQQVLLVKPMTFMNNSGESVSALAKFYKVPTQRILVISDDLDLDHAAIRMRPKGGHGGHNGLRSIMERLGNTQDFPRIKIGIGRPAGQLPIATWVLQDFSKKEMESVEVAVHEACDLVRSVMSLGLEKALSVVKSKEAPPPQPKQPKPPAPAGSLRAGPAGSLTTQLTAAAGVQVDNQGTRKAVEQQPVLVAPSVLTK